MNKILELLEEVVKDRAYGELVIKYEAGKIVIIKKTESIKISEQETYIFKKGLANHPVGMAVKTK